MFPAAHQTESAMHTGPMSEWRRNGKDTCVALR
jgi:hypothetical protein